MNLLRWIHRILPWTLPSIPRWTISQGRLQSADRDLGEDFIEASRRLPAPRVLELGARRWPGTATTSRRDWIPHAAEFHGTDREPGPGVDLIADLHRLSAVTGPERYDVVIGCSVFEHLKYPLLAAHEIMKVLAPGGLLFIQTHHTFPVHGFPSDHHRFSVDALRTLFPAAMGLDVLATDYEFPCRIVSRQDPLTADFLCFLNVRLLARKVGPTPDSWVYELD